MKFNVLVALLGLASAQNFLQEDMDLIDTDGLVEVDDLEELKTNSFLPTFEKTLHELPKSLKANVDSMEHVIN